VSSYGGSYSGSRPTTFAAAHALLSGQTSRPPNTLQAGVGFFSVSASQAALLHARNPLAAAESAFGVTGQAAKLLYNRTLKAGTGGFAVTGENAKLIYDRIDKVSEAAFSVSGAPAKLLYNRVLKAGMGSFSLTGEALNFSESGGTSGALTLVADTGYFSLTGDAMNPVLDRLMTADTGMFSLTGEPVVSSIFTPTQVTWTSVGSDALFGGYAAPTAYTSAAKTWPAGLAVICFFDEGGLRNLNPTLLGVTLEKIAAGNTVNYGSIYTGVIPGGTGALSVSDSGAIGEFAWSGGVVVTHSNTPVTMPVISDLPGQAEPVQMPSFTVPDLGLALYFVASFFGSSSELPLTWTGATPDVASEAYSSGGGNGVVIGGAHTTTVGADAPTITTSNGGLGYGGDAGFTVGMVFGP
jgi:hypothetical protein